MQITKEQILKCPNGISSYYYKIDNCSGIKFFGNKNERDSSKYNQHIAYLTGLAPKVGKDIYSDGYWGYYTEHVDMLHNNYPKWKMVPDKIKFQIDVLIDDLENSCDIIVDDNWKNFGINSNGNIVYVDFGWCDSKYYNY